MFSLRTQLYSPSYYPDVPVLDEEFDFAAMEDAELADFSVTGEGGSETIFNS